MAFDLVLSFTEAVDHGNEEVEQRLNTVLIQIAVSAKCLYAWPLIKKLLKFRFHQVEECVVVLNDCRNLS
jgi:hypothetical protein